MRSGAVLQLNASSLAGLHGSTPARTAISIAESGLPFVLASDAHSSTRPPLLSDAVRRLSSAGIDADVIRAAVDLGPARLFEDGLPAGQPGTSVDLGLGAARRAA